MEPVESNHVDKSQWTHGPWNNEPDRVEWRSEGTPRLPCLIVRGPSGALCGYVGVPDGHPYHGQEGGFDVDCHGGVTYTAPCVEGAHICHVPQAGEPDTVWWIGFDCAHSCDIRPADYNHQRWDSSMPAHYREIDFVRREVNALAVQLQRVAKGLPPNEE